MNGEKERSITPLWGILVFVFVLAVMVFIFAPVQHYLGMYGLAVTELGLLGIALGAAFLSGQRLKEVFPLRMPRLRQIAGVIVLWLGSYMMVLLVTIIIACLYPELFFQVSDSLSTTLSSVPPLLTLLIGAVMPAVCEECLHRGFILSTFQRVENKWIVILCMGILFGIFHLDPIRFLPTALLGGVLTYIMVETRNLALPMLFHFINNAPAASLTGAAATSAAGGGTAVDHTLALFQTYPLFTIGMYLSTLAAAPLITVCGAHFLKDKKMSEMEVNEKASYKKKVIIALVIGILMFLWGTIISSLQMAKHPSLLNDLMRDLQLQL